MSLAELLAFTFGCFVLGALLTALGARRADAATRTERWRKFGVYFLIVHAVLGCALLGTPWLLVLGLSILALGARELGGALARIGAGGSARRAVIAALYAALGAGFLFTLARLAPAQAAFLYLVIAAFDGFSQLSGHLLGRHRLAPRLSPGKTVEGLAGGALGALAVAWALRALAGIGGAWLVVAAALVIAGALAGDLAASWVKRRAGIKDFGALLPGQGGVLDRFDSFIGAGGLLAPMVWLVSLSLVAP